LHKAFEKFGTILSAKISIDKNHNSRGYGFIQFSSVEEAQ
jgi:RNA recognition motif-containing protein